MKKITTDLLLKEKPTKWKEHYGEYSRIGLILENYSLEDKIHYLKKIGFENWLERFLEQQITEYIINIQKNNTETRKN